MSDVAIRVENLSKHYRIGATQDRHDTLRDAVTGLFRRRPSSSAPRTSDTDLWALKNVSFEVKQGEVVGIIGRNGAGKSTLLKILSRITEPTSGRVALHGRVASLLEVGTGFHPELTGRENIFLNGAILGMKRAEIDRQFDEIVAFAEIEKFLDTPVKRYSSGMYVRLAFAVAAHLEPEILLVDEVLAVGDAAFQKKCLGKMGDVAKNGRTVLFVSHNLAAVVHLCSQSILLNNGTISRFADSQEVLDLYAAYLEPVHETILESISEREGSGDVRFLGIRIANDSGNGAGRPHSGQSVNFIVDYEAHCKLHSGKVVFSIGFYNMVGQPLFLCRSDFGHFTSQNLSSVGSVVCRIPKFPLPPGRFRMNLHCEVNGVVADWVRDSLYVDVGDGDFYGTGRLPSRQRGDILVDHEWFTQIS